MLLARRRRVIVPPELPPEITFTQQPSSQVASNGSATFAALATASDGSTVSYLWKVSTDGGLSYTDAGSTTSSLTVTGITSSYNGRRYRVVVSATGADSVTSNHATLIVPQPTAVITSQPTAFNAFYAGGDTNGYQNVGSVISASINNGDIGSTLTYSWQIREVGSSVWQDLSIFAVWNSYFGYCSGQTSNNLQVGYKGSGPTALSVLVRCQVGVSPSGIGSTSSEVGGPQFIS